MTGTDKFSSNIRPLMMENVALMDEVAKKNEETWKGIEKTLGGFRSLENEVMQPVLDKVKDIATAVAEAGTAITDPGGLTEGFIGVKDLTSGIVFFIEEASGKIKTMKGDLDEISKMDMSNLSGGTEEEPVGRQLKRGD